MPGTGAVHVLVFVDQHVSVPEVNGRSHRCIRFEQEGRLHHEIAKVDGSPGPQGLLIELVDLRHLERLLGRLACVVIDRALEHGARECPVACRAGELILGPRDRRDHVAQDECRVPQVPVVDE